MHLKIEFKKSPYLRKVKQKKVKKGGFYEKKKANFDDIFEEDLFFDEIFI
jgi:hypothetical protein